MKITEIEDSTRSGYVNYIERYIRLALPYVAFDPIHLTRWRGNALAQLAAPEALGVLYCALERLDLTLARAEAALRVDLAIAIDGINEQDAARVQELRARSLALRSGSIRQLRRLRNYTA